MCNEYSLYWNFMFLMKFQKSSIVVYDCQSVNEKSSAAKKQRVDA